MTDRQDGRTHRSGYVRRLPADSAFSFSDLHQDWKRLPHMSRTLENIRNSDVSDVARCATLGS